MELTRGSSWAYGSVGHEAEQTAGGQRRQFDSKVRCWRAHTILLLLCRLLPELLSCCPCNNMRDVATGGGREQVQWLRGELFAPSCPPAVLHDMLVIRSPPTHHRHRAQIAAKPGRLLGLWDANRKELIPTAALLSAKVRSAARDPNQPVASVSCQFYCTRMVARADFCGTDLARGPGPTRASGT